MCAYYPTLELSVSHQSNCFCPCLLLAVKFLLSIMFLFELFLFVCFFVAFSAIDNITIDNTCGGRGDLDYINALVQHMHAI